MHPLVEALLFAVILINLTAIRYDLDKIQRTQVNTDLRFLHVLKTLADKLGVKENE